MVITMVELMISGLKTEFKSHYDNLSSSHEMGFMWAK
jgi:hypothetical protein